MSKNRPKLHPCTFQLLKLMTAVFFFCEDVLATQIQLSALAETLGMKKTHNFWSHFCMRIRYQFFHSHLSSMPSSCLITHIDNPVIGWLFLASRMLVATFWWFSSRNHRRPSTCRESGNRRRYESRIPMPSMGLVGFAYQLVPMNISHSCS